MIDINKNFTENLHDIYNTTTLDIVNNLHNINQNAGKLSSSDKAYWSDSILDNLDQGSGKYLIDLYAANYTRTTTNQPGQFLPENKDDELRYVVSL